MASRVACLQHAAYGPKKLSKRLSYFRTVSSCVSPTRPARLGQGGAGINQWQGSSRDQSVAREQPGAISGKGAAGSNQWHKRLRAPASSILLRALARTVRLLRASARCKCVARVARGGGRRRLVFTVIICSAEGQGVSRASAARLPGRGRSLGRLRRACAGRRDCAGRRHCGRDPAPYLGIRARAIRAGHGLGPG